MIYGIITEPSDVVTAQLDEVTAQAHKYAKARATLLWLYTADNESIRASADIENLPDDAYVLRSVGFSISDQFCPKSALNLR